MASSRDDHTHDENFLEALGPAQEARPVEPVTVSPMNLDGIPTVEPFRRGLAILAWPVILALVAFLAIFPHLRETAPSDKALVDRISGVLMQLQTRYALGASKLLGQPKLKEDLYHQLEGMSGGSVIQRLRFAVVAGEFKGWSAALDQLDDLDEDLAKHNHQLTETERKTLDVLVQLYTDYDEGKLAAPNVDQADRELLKKELGWFGQLALAPEGGEDRSAREAVLATAQRTFLVIIIAVGAVFGAALFGFVGLIVLLFMAAQGTLRGGLRTGSSHHAVYAETFAVYMLLFLGFNLLADYLQVGKDLELLVLGFAVLGSLLALAWPVIRGIPWCTVREDIGLTWGRNPVAEPFIGVGCYAMGLPLLAIGFILTLILMAVQSFIELKLKGPDTAGPFDPSLNSPAHPILEYLASGSWWARAQILFVASVCAPIVEEIMFRGVLYRHVRESTRGLGPVLSVLISAAWVSFIFAIIHPQGWVAVPALMALAFAFTIAREWRGTVVPGIAAHALNNGMLMLFVMLAAGG
jgi:membrane protease YdiL (CAAX protease family)